MWQKPQRETEAATSISFKCHSGVGIPGVSPSARRSSNSFKLEFEHMAGLIALSLSLSLSTLQRRLRAESCGPLFHSVELQMKDLKSLLQVPQMQLKELHARHTVDTALYMTVDRQRAFVLLSARS